MKELFAILGLGAVSWLMAVLMGPVVGMITGWAVGLFFSGWFYEVLAVIGLGPIPLYKLGAFMGFVGAFFVPGRGGK